MAKKYGKLHRADECIHGKEPIYELVLRCEVKSPRTLASMSFEEKLKYFKEMGWKSEKDVVEKHVGCHTKIDCPHFVKRKNK